MFIEKLSKEDITDIFQKNYGKMIVELNGVGTKSVELTMKTNQDDQQPFVAYLKDFDINAVSNTAFHNCHSRVLPLQRRTINMWRSALYEKFGEEYKKGLEKYLDNEKNVILNSFSNSNENNHNEKTK